MPNGWRYCLIERRPAAAQGDTGPDCAPPTYATVRPRLRMSTTGRRAGSTKFSSSSLPPAARLRRPDKLLVTRQMWCRQVVVIVRACPKGLPRWLHRILRACAPSIRRSRAGTRRRPLRTAVPHAHQGRSAAARRLGPRRLTASQRRDLMEIIEDRYGRGSTLITSQLPVEAWHEVISNPTFADAILDRLVHNAYRFARSKGRPCESPRSTRMLLPQRQSRRRTSPRPSWQREQRNERACRGPLRPPPWVNRDLPRAPLRPLGGGHSAARAGPSC